MNKKQAEALVAKQSSLLTSTQRQEQYVAELGLMPQECPSCGVEMTLFDACTTPGGYEPGGDVKPDTFQCTGCKRPLQKVVPFMDTRPWFWVIDHAAEKAAKTS